MINIIKYNLDLILIINPISKERISIITKEANRFLYIVSSLNITNLRNEITTDISSIINTVRENINIPCVIIFDISTPEYAKNMAQLSDGVIVGLSIILIIDKYLSLIHI